jgi:hypothetical protein
MAAGSARCGRHSVSSGSKAEMIVGVGHVRFGPEADSCGAQHVVQWGRLCLAQKADVRVTRWHVCFGPCVDGSGLARRIFTLQHWSEQPCVRPVCAVLMTAGHNALRGSGPGQQHAFEDALAQVGCPDRRIDRRCIKCCSPSQPLRHAGLSGVISFTPRERQVPYSVRFWPSWPRPSWRVCWRARWRRPWWVAAPTIQ